MLGKTNQVSRVVRNAFIGEKLTTMKDVLPIVPQQSSRFARTKMEDRQGKARESRGKACQNQGLVV